jgi:hypothetical protein
MYHVYNLSGVWCTYPNRTTKHGDVKLIQRSNKDLGLLFKNVGMRCWKREVLKDAYIRRIIREIRSSISDPNVKQVYIIGHSYGGYVASEAVLEFKNDPNSHKLIVTTYASIYLLSKSDMRGIQMKQFMKRNDIAVRCNEMDKSAVTWINSKPKKSIFDEWIIHIDYPIDSIVENLIKKLNSK